MEKLFIICTFDCSFQYYEETVDQWVKEQGDGIVLEYDLVKINDHKSHSFYTVSSLKEFAKMLDTEWAREWDKANNCKDIVYKLEIVEWLINSWMTNKWNDKSWQKDFLNMKSHSPSDAKLLMGGVKGLKDAWRLGVLHVEYERLKKKQMQKDQ